MILLISGDISLSFAITDLGNLLPLFPASLSLDSRCVGCVGCSRVRVPVPVPVPVRSSKHVHTTADGTSKGLRIPRPYCDGVWFQLLICHYGRYAVPIVTLLPPLGSSTRQTTLIVGGLTKGSERVLSL